MSSSHAIINVFRHVVFCPSFLLLDDVHLRAALVILSLCFIRTCPSHLNHRSLISKTAFAAGLLVEFHVIYFIGSKYQADLAQTSIVFTVHVKISKMKYNCFQMTLTQLRMTLKMRVNAAW